MPKVVSLRLGVPPIDLDFEPLLRQPGDPVQHV